MKNKKRRVILLMAGAMAFFAYGQDVEVEGNFLVQGRVGVGFESYPANGLEVDGTMRAKEVVAVPAEWPDFVFEGGYKLPSLTDVEAHIAQQGCLPGMPSAANIAENGADLLEINTKLLQKVEELTLYIIGQEKELDKQGGEIVSLKEKAEKLPQ